MSRLSGLAVLALGSLLALAAPTPENLALARKYAPQWRFQTSEVYWPSTVEYFLAGVKQVDRNGNTVTETVTTSNVDDPPNQGSGLFLATDINAGKGGFLRGQNPSTIATSVYTFIAPKANGVVDLFYWLFTPFNEGKSVPLIGQVGDHVGDWERMTVRTVNGVATQVDYHAHGDSGSGTLPWSQVVKFDNGQRPVGYIARGSHGFWATAGTFTYVNAIVFKLQDVTSDGGVSWDTKDSLVPFGYPESYVGLLDWLNYKGAWGNDGQRDCWWYIFHNECQVVAGPGGPLRDDVLGAANIVAGSTIAGSIPKSMKGPLSQTLGTASTETKSSFTLYIDNSVTQFASDSSFTHLAVQQTCTSVVETAKDGKENGTPATSTTFAATPLTKAPKFTIAPAACAPYSSVTSYTIGLCVDSTEENCQYSSPRVLRAFSSEASVHGVQITTAIIVTDVDTWEW